MPKKPWYESLEGRIRGEDVQDHRTQPSKFVKYLPWIISGAIVFGIVIGYLLR